MLPHPRTPAKSPSTGLREGSSFLRSIGLELPFIFGYGKGYGETPKRVIDTTRGRALARCGVHILPVLVSIVIVTLNCGQTYLGRTLPGSILNPSINIAFLQVAAKVQELAIVASVATIVIHVLRSELVSGEGIPLGLLGGGFMFTSISYFWSPEFWGSTYNKHPWNAKWKVYGILVLGGLFASLAGPSTAILLIPEDQPWKAGGTSIYLPGTAEEWSPTTVRVDAEGLGTKCTVSNSIDILTCPAGGYPGLWDKKSFVDIYKTATYSTNTKRNLTTDFSIGAPSVVVSSDYSLLPALQGHGQFRGVACETSTQAPRVAESMYQHRVMLDWIQEAYAIPYQPFKYGPSLVEYKYFGTMAASVKSRIPASRVACTAAQNLSSSEQSLLFPRFEDNGCWTTAQILSLRNVTALRQVPTDKLRSSWQLLPPEFGSVSGGFVLELPWDTNSNSRPVIGCSVDARWTDGTLLTSSVFASMTGSGMDGSFLPVMSLASIDDAVPTLSGSDSYSEFRPVLLHPSTTRTVFDESWLRALTPVVSEGGPGYDNSNSTILEALLLTTGLLDGLSGGNETFTEKWNLSTLGVVNRTVALEWWLSIITTDGLSRVGSVKVLNTTGPTRSWELINYEKQGDFSQKLFGCRTALVPPNSSFVERKVTITIGGYSYMANTITDWLSVALLVTHIVLAVAHSIYVVSTGRSSSAWDTLTELLVLMQNSPKAPKALRNTNAGMKDILTYSRRARIFSTRMGNENDEVAEELSNVELIFDEDNLSCHSSTNSTHDHLHMAFGPQNPYIDRPPPHDRTGSVGSERSRGDSTLSLSSKAQQTTHIERLRSISTSSNPSISVGAISRRPILGRVRPGIAYGHSTAASINGYELVGGEVATTSHLVNSFGQSIISEHQRLL